MLESRSNSYSFCFKLAPTLLSRDKDSEGGFVTHPKLKWYIGAKEFNIACVREQRS